MIKRNDIKYKVNCTKTYHYQAPSQPLVCAVSVLKIRQHCTAAAPTFLTQYNRYCITECFSMFIWCCNCCYSCGNCCICYCIWFLNCCNNFQQQQKQQTKSFRHSNISIHLLLKWRLVFLWFFSVVVVTKEEITAKALETATLAIASTAVGTFCSQ